MAALPGIPGLSYRWALPVRLGFHEGRAFRAKTPAIAAVNATGSGDSTIAGFAHAIAAGADDVTVLKTANTCRQAQRHGSQDRPPGHGPLGRDLQQR